MTHTNTPVEPENRADTSKSDTAQVGGNQVAKPCVFCEKIADESLVTYGKAVVFTPLNPVTGGHLLVVPKTHVTKLAHMTVEDKSHLINAIALATSRLSEYNIINSCGSNATQTVPHLHFHVVPRRKDDGLQLPWTNQHRGIDLKPSDLSQDKGRSKSPTTPDKTQVIVVTCIHGFSGCRQDNPHWHVQKCEAHKRYFHMSCYAITNQSKAGVTDG